MRNPNLQFCPVRAVLLPLNNRDQAQGIGSEVGRREAAEEEGAGGAEVEEATRVRAAGRPALPKKKQLNLSHWKAKRGKSLTRGILQLRHSLLI